MRIHLSSLSSVALLGTLLSPVAAWAQGEVAPAAPAPAVAPAEPAAPAAVEPAAPAAEPAPDAAVAPAVTEPPPPAVAVAGPAAPAEEEEDTSVPGWFRIDSDLLALQLWVGATHSLGPVDIATDIYVNSGTFAEFDIGPSFTLEFGESNSFIAIPMAGIGVDWANQKAATLVAPQLFLYLTAGPIYFESWTQFFINSVFDDAATDSLYLRNFVLFKLSDHVAIGPHMEATLDLSGDSDNPVSLPVHGAVSLNYGENNTLLLALGYETQESAREIVVGQNTDDPANPTDIIEDHGLSGRFTFVRLW